MPQNAIIHFFGITLELFSHLKLTTTARVWFIELILKAAKKSRSKKMHRFSLFYRPLLRKHRHISGNFLAHIVGHT